MPAPTVEKVETASKDLGIASTNAKESADIEGLSEEEIKARVLKQVEFYFTDSNLPFDKFLWTLHSANPEHWVPLATIVSFKRMRQFQSKGLPWIADLLREQSNLVEIDSSGAKIRRRGEVKRPADQLDRNVYAKGFGDETPTLQDELDQFFSQWGKVNAVRMRRVDHTKKFKGSVFCEFSSVDSVKKFLEADPKPQWKGTELLTMSKEAYCEMKIKEKGLTGKAAQINRGSRKGFNAFDENDKDKKKPAAEENPEIYLEFMGKRLKVNTEDGGSIDESEIPYVKGASLKFTGCGGDVRFAEVKAPLKDRFERPPYIKFTRGDEFGLLGFDKALSEEDIAFVRENIKTINESPVTWEALEEDVEKEFQIERAQFAAQRIVSGEGASGNRSGRSGRGRGGKGGRGGRGGHKGGKGNSRNARNDEKNDKPPTGEKRKRGVEPDGGADTKGQSVPIIHVSKKAKADES
ncbi:hypothetical protein Clacol_006864 [Clathrus columnatus]|uniref:Lupus La protein n=1 Tax=Clathrus columnatus TaxID=1419009 RepID=A0AAV5AJG2_9AGAM|nr:hypothetical protein Clacol_006864 [Clathrus columnatus]